MKAADQDLPAEPVFSPAPAVSDVPWQRLDWRMFVVRPGTDLVRAIPGFVGALLLGSGGNKVWEWIAVAIAGIAIVVGVGHILTARYRITDEQMELRTGIVNRRHRAVPRDRIRTVDVTSEFRHRLFGLSAVKIGTGRHTKDRKDELVLDAVSKAEAQRLATVLLHREPELSVTDSVDKEVTQVASQETLLAEFERNWIRFSPFALSGIVTIAAFFGILYHFADNLHINLINSGVLRWLIEYFTGTPSVFAIAIIVITLLVLVALTSMAGYVLSNWNFKLSRGNSALHVRRGLISTRAVSIEENRLRGIALHEPLPVRLLGGARCVAVASGLAPLAGSSTLLPSAPVKLAHEVATTVLREQHDPMSVTLQPHPRSALRRRLIRSIGGTILVTVVLFVAASIGPVPGWLWPIALILTPIMGVIGVDRYRSLGHAINGPYLLGRKGSLERETFVLKREAVIGWRLESSFFQRRAGLMTLMATVAAGHGAYAIVDIAESDALRFADEAIPELLTPFLEQV